MKTYVVKLMVYGFATIEAESLEEAIDQSEGMETKDFELSNDFDIEVLGEQS